MDMLFIYARADDKGVVAFCELLRKLTADLVCSFRHDFAGLKGLAKMVDNKAVIVIDNSDITKPCSKNMEAIRQFFYHLNLQRRRAIYFD